MCGSLLNLLSPNCTRFDGKQFHNVSSTAIGHQYGAMVDFGEIVIMGGMNYGQDSKLTSLPYDIFSK